MRRRRFCGRFGRIIELVGGWRRRMWGVTFISLGKMSRGLGDGEGEMVAEVMEKRERCTHSVEL
jgi:hypothetical protein